jgi:hypothetical protein
MRALRTLGTSLALAVLSSGTRAADEAEKLRHLGLAESGTEAPSLLRVLLTFLLVVALAWAAVWLMRRHGFRLTGKLGLAAAPGASPIRAVARSVLPGGVTCHVVEAQGRSVLITVTRTGVSSVILGPPPGPEQSQS